MPRINLGSCPITLASLNDENFDQTRLVIVGSTIYPVIGEAAWNKFTSNLVVRCPLTREEGNYHFLKISTVHLQDNILLPINADHLLRE